MHENKHTADIQIYSTGPVEMGEERIQCLVTQLNALSCQLMISGINISIITGVLFEYRLLS